MHDDSKHGAHVDDPQRAGAKQPERFQPHKAARLEEPSRLEYLPPEKIVALLDLPQGATLVDFGTGTGVFAIRVAQARPDVNVVALDEQPEMLDLLRAKPEAKSLANLRLAMPDEIPGLRGRADRVLALNVLHELGDDALTALGSLLGPEGSVIFIDWNADVDRPVGPPRDHVYGPSEAVARLVKMGYATEILEAMRYHYVVRARFRGTKA